VLLVVGYAGLARAPTVGRIAAFYALGGVGVGSVYTVAIDTPVNWFEDRRGLATGVVGFAYAGLSFALIPFVQGGLEAAFGTTVLGLGALAGPGALFAVPVLRDPAAGDGSDGGAGRADAPDSPPGTDGRPRESEGEGEGGSEADGGSPAAGAPGGCAWRETVRIWQFWLPYGVFIAVNGVERWSSGRSSRSPRRCSSRP
jgi:OFA family oxalate/formate antiporter-like MFS transporter